MTLDELKIELHTAALELLQQADSEQHPAYEEYLLLVTQLRDIDGVTLQ